MRRMLRLICLIVGHDWAPPLAVGSRDYRTICHRCTKVIRGDWAFIEDHNAWEHYR